MIVVMRHGAEQAQIEAVLRRISAEGLATHVFHGEERVVIAILDEVTSEELGEELAMSPAVEEVGRTTRPYRLASREVRPGGSRVQVAGLTVGGGELLIGAGVSRLRQGPELAELARLAEAGGANLFWFGRPRGAELGVALPLLAELRRSTRLPVLAEVWGPEEIDPLGMYSDGLILGARHLHSYPLVKAVSRLTRPVVLTRGIATSIEEWLLVAEQVLKGGNFQVILCEQGIRTFETMAQSTLDFGALAIVKRLSHLPVVANPSLASGRRDLVASLALGVAGAGADGVLLDVHLGAEDESAGGPQSIALDEFRQLAERLRALSAAMASSPG